jgi:hypothetical protein
MDDGAKLHFDVQEFRTLSDTGFFHYKQQITQKVSAAFGRIIHRIRELPEVAAVPWPTGTDTTLGKISKGEQHEGLPWLVADMPRYFSKHDTLLYRVMLHWGQPFSMQWVLSGKPLEQFGRAMVGMVASDSRILIATGGKLWDTGRQHYQPIQPGEELWPDIQESGFLKVAMFLPLEDAAHLETNAVEFARLGMKAMSS